MCNTESSHLLYSHSVHWSTIPNICHFYAIYIIIIPNMRDTSLDIFSFYILLDSTNVLWISHSYVFSVHASMHSSCGASQQNIHSFTDLGQVKTHSQQPHRKYMAYIHILYIFTAMLLLPRCCTAQLGAFVVRQAGDASSFVNVLLLLHPHGCCVVLSCAHMKCI